jgi:hypothetical protein
MTIEAGMSKGSEDTVYIPGPAVETLDKPRFDFSNVSYKQGRESGRVQARIQHVAKKIEAAAAEDDIEPLLDEFDRLMDQQEQNIFAAVAYIPQGWLVKTAPHANDINWQDAESIKYLRADKLQVLAKAKQEAQNNPN